ncbi:hypothetical protein J2736_006708 [Paenibacillus qinlingensis]|uniref:Uncharacterized protein n=1 Tax=Paenibacillus qinlingensis TaxID=1837343 RepID=A0ABU1P6T1_9BACL|nr:hypothetical protein [Paenibacillus qinlingensis]
MLNALISITLCAGLFAAAFYAAHYVVQLRHMRDNLQHDVAESKIVIQAMEDRIEQLEFERDDRLTKFEHKVSEPSSTTGWNAFEVRR